MLDESRLPLHPAIGIIARILFTLTFFLSGLTHFTDIDGTVSLAMTGCALLISQLGVQRPAP